jgi:hypothetical protein
MRPEVEAQRRQDFSTNSPARFIPYLVQARSPA